MHGWPADGVNEPTSTLHQAESLQGRRGWSFDSECCPAGRNNCIYHLANTTKQQNKGESRSSVRVQWTLLEHRRKKDERHLRSTASIDAVVTTLLCRRKNPSLSIHRQVFVLKPDDSTHSDISSRDTVRRLSKTWKSSYYTNHHAGAIGETYYDGSSGTRCNLEHEYRVLFLGSFGVNKCESLFEPALRYHKSSSEPRNFSHNEYASLFEPAVRCGEVPFEAGILQGWLIRRSCIGNVGWVVIPMQLKNKTCCESACHTIDPYLFQSQWCSYQCCSKLSFYTQRISDFPPSYQGYCDSSS